MQVGETVLIIGGGVAGLAVATALSKQGLSPVLVEKDARLGGRTLEYACKATETCNMCNVCLTNKMRDEVKTLPLTVYTHSEVTDMRKNGDGFVVEITHNPRYLSREDCLNCGTCLRKCPDTEGRSFLNGQRDYCSQLCFGQCQICVNECPEGVITAHPEIDTRKLDASAIVLCVGSRPFDASIIGNYSSSESDKIMDAERLEQLLCGRGPSRNALLSDNKEIAFIHCVGSRDENYGNYCSQACCHYSLAMARSILQDKDEINVSMYYMDLQAPRRDSQNFLRECEEAGVQLVRSKPGEIQLLDEGKRVRITFEDPKSGEVKHHSVDLAVLAVGMRPAEETPALAEMLRINRDSDGFFAVKYGDPADGVRTNTPGIFVAGTCGGPKNIRDTISHAGWAAQEAANFVRSRSL